MGCFYKVYLPPGEIENLKNSDAKDIIYVITMLNLKEQGGF